MGSRPRSGFHSDRRWVAQRGFRARRRATWLWAVALCATSTLLVGLTLHMFDGYDRGVAKIDPDAISPMLTVAWWLAFSTSLYWSEMSEHASRSRKRDNAP